MMKILMLDNYDSFTFNLVHILRQFKNVQVDVKRNDEIDLDEVSSYDKILLSPGPGIPSEAGIMIDLIREYREKKSILGVCLGHQAIAEVFGGSLLNLKRVMHGVSTETHVIDNSEILFSGLPSHFKAGRYHSWVVNKGSLPAELKITAMSEDEVIMALRHEKFDVKGVQFHPESILTEHGKEMIENWLKG